MYSTFGNSLLKFGYSCLQVFQTPYPTPRTVLDAPQMISPCIHVRPLPIPSRSMPVLVSEWRALWSRTPGTTDPMAPFGVVTLAASGNEGGADLGSMRLAQTAGYGVLPNALMPNTFLAQAHDLDDPYINQTCDSLRCCPYNFNASYHKTCHGCDGYCNSAGRFFATS